MRGYVTSLWDDMPVVLAGGISLALIIGAHLFEMNGYAPCKLCTWQRWPHYAAIAVLMFATVTKQFKSLPLLLVIAACLETSGWIGFYHAGVEYGYWDGPETCSGLPDISGSPADFLKRIELAHVIRCDAASWDLFGVSMAGYNALISMGGAAFAGWRGLEIWRKN